jgi:hypothetical protein
VLVELGLVEERLAVVKEVLDLVTVTDVAARLGGGAASGARVAAPTPCTGWPG